MTQFIEISFLSENYDQACQLRNEILRQPLGLDLREEDLSAEADYFHFGILEGSRVIACGLAIPVSAVKAKIRQMAVAGAFQNQGIGKKLLYNIEASLQQRGFELLELDARATAVGFYQKLGYEKVGEEFQSVSIPHQRMRKSLKKSLQE
ncbi:GNAT family N-acetyltransferase [Gimesia sp.]|uniref:GNAT family N-acetyltransferase n=1 Tax=Gimesia sp. TaxID=2024833 RepID=UPI000C4CD0D5|nr:GNAT family N-acetyltransferase [Gimesia sp.]MAX40955.1 GNAT family N-acetyltransferase [Gimesia sp.]HBL42576.1 GNAT family N-acetyltransferase [Planctomycetaceae bacterium]|tara:strand:- start:4170 stop:4619 length:450 start_codon:yes stop_codon:yes gene_type:complete